MPKQSIFPGLLAALALMAAGCVNFPAQAPSGRTTQPQASTASTPAGGMTVPQKVASAHPNAPAQCPAPVTPGAQSKDPAVDTEPGYEAAPEPESPAVAQVRPPSRVPRPAAEHPAKEPQQILDEALETCDLAQDFWQKGELENAMDALDQAYSLILDVDVDGDHQLIQQKDDLRYMISKRILEIFASRHTVATGNHDAIPLVMNEHVEAEIKLFTGRERNFFLDSYRRSGMYRPYIVQQLRAAGLPEELSWLPLIESGFKDRAMSSARALGLWQFIASTGYKFGLSRDQYIDERLDPEKATLAAIAYLKELHQIFGDWTTCLAAYNCGEGKVLRVIRGQNVNYLDNFWDLYRRLPRETARYVPRFLAALHIIRNPEKYGMELCEPLPPLTYTKVAIQRKVHIDEVASALGMDKSEMRLLNPELRYQITPPTEYELKVPPEKEQDLLAKIGSIKVHSPPQPAYFVHRIRRGETLSTIARRYGVSLSSLCRANGISSRSVIVAGRTLRVPGRGSSAASYHASSGGASRTVPASHRVRRGDSLWNLARRYGTTVAAIKRANGLSGSRLVVGQTLKIPGGGAAAKPSGDAQVYVVRSGDSPYTIARAHNMRLDRFLEINRLTKYSKIYPGQKVYVE